MLLPKFFVTLHLRALPEIFVLHYYFFAGNASVLVDPEQSLTGILISLFTCRYFKKFQGHLIFSQPTLGMDLPTKKFGQIFMEWQ